MLKFFSNENTRAMPPEVLNWRLIFATASACMAGSMFGFDTGNIGGIITLPSFKETFGLNADGPNVYQDANLSANIVTALQAGAVIGSLFAHTAADRFGRRPTLIGGAVIFLIGCVLQLVANLGTLYAGRVIAGIATGLTSVVAPMYVSESAPRAIRGALATCFNLIIITSLSLAFWINYGVSKWMHPTNTQWRVPMGVQMIPGGLLLIGMLFQKESVRYLITHDRHEDAANNLTLAEITASVSAKRAAVGDASVVGLIKEIFTVPSNRRRYILAIILQIFQQLTGTNAINYYAPSIFATVGVSGTSSSLLTTGVYGIVKLATTLIYVFLIIDNVGRRRPLMTGALIQAGCLLYLAIFVKVAVIKPDNISVGGYFGLIFIYLYAFGWSFGWSVVPWVVPSEIFPNRIRAISMSSVYAFQWLLNFAITQATPHAFNTIKPWGTYLLFSLFTFIGVVWTFFFFPELKGRSIESMDRLFDQSAFTMRERAYPTEEEKTLNVGPLDKTLEDGNASAGHINNPAEV
ncbi:H(+)/hexose cotransporter 1 [Xylariaceae sp. FL0255]|nr:H(+)/hexose cotransporter 1 [Xylariaceae sp. FL0255]